MRSQKGFTLIELLVVLAIIGILLALLIPAISAASGKHNWYKTKDRFVARIATTYILEEQRVTVQKATNIVDVTFVPTTSAEIIASPNVVVLSNENDSYIEKYNSETLQANFEPGKWYYIETIGFVDEKNHRYPNIVTATRIPDPKVEAEIEY